MNVEPLAQSHRVEADEYGPSGPDQNYSGRLPGRLTLNSLPSRWAKRRGLIR
jgi:hypothetical protein